MEKTHFLRLLTKFYAGRITEKELTSLRHAVNNNFEYRKICLDLNSFFQQRTAVPTDEAEKIWADIKKWKKGALKEWSFIEEEVSESQPVLNRPRLVVYAKWKRLTAAVFLLLMLAGLSYYVSSNRKSGDSAMITIANTNSFRSLLELPDGTKIWINKNSRISYNKDFAKEKREVNLIGEAYFDVAHNAAMPMIIHAAMLDILVRGTIFNVKAYPEEKTITASLLNGKIEVYEKNNRDRKAILLPNDQLIYDIATIQAPVVIDEGAAKPAKSGYYNIEQVDLQNSEVGSAALLWMKDSIIFNQTPLKSVLDQLSKRYNVAINADHSLLSEFTYSGEFRDESLEEALAALCLGSNLSYKKSDDGMIIFKSKN